MRRTIIALFMLSFISFTIANAQPRMDPKERVKELTTRLKLTDKQAKQMEEIFTQQGDQMREAFQNAGGDREQMRETMMKLREEANKKIEKILDDKQKAEYKKYLEEQQARRQQMGPRGNQ